MKKSKKKIILIVLLLVLAIVYFGSKMILIHRIPKTTDSIKEAFNAFENPETITIFETPEPIEDYLTYEDMKIRNDFEPFEYEGQDSPMYTIKNTNIRVSFSKEAKDSFVTYVKENAQVPNLPFDIEKDLEKNNIKTDYELYKYVVENLNKKVHIFNSFHTIKKVHTLYNAAASITNVQKVVLISGDYEGYILETNGDRTAHIDHNNENYVLHIWSNSIDEELYEFISTIQFN